MRKTIKLTESDLHKIVKESVNRIITETYRGTLYHYTSLPLLYNILRQNRLIADESDDFCDYRKGTYDSKYDAPMHSLCFTRDKTYDIKNGGNCGCGVSCRLVFDAERLMQLRYAKLYPVNFSKKAKINRPSEAEERLWGVDVNPLDKYVERIDIIVSDLSEPYQVETDFTTELYHKYYDKYFEKYPDADNDDYYEFLGRKMIEGIMRFKRFKGKINVINTIDKNNSERGTHIDSQYEIIFSLFIKNSVQGTTRKEVYKLVKALSDVEEYDHSFFPYVFDFSGQEPKQLKWVNKDGIGHYRDSFVTKVTANSVDEASEKMKPILAKFNGLYDVVTIDSVTPIKPKTIRKF